MFSSVRYFLSDLGHWLGAHRLIVALALLVLAGGGGAAAYLSTASSEDPEERAAPSAPAPDVIVQQVSVPEETDDLGFPAFATKNTTRVAGADALADAAAVALAVHPSIGGVEGPGAVSIVDAADWPAGVAAASLVAAPIGAPILLSQDGELPALSASAIRALDPAGSPETDGSQVFAIGDAARPEDFEAREVEGANAAELAAEIDRLRTELAGEPEHVLITTSEEAAIAMPAASWAARSGDPVLFVDSDGVPAATAEALESHDKAPVYVLGAEPAISAKVMKEIEEIAPGAVRVGAEDPVENAIEFARYSNGSFGWNINDPGHGFVIASSDRPLDAAVASPLSASGTWGPLLLTDDAKLVPDSLRGLLLDLKPGYDEDPTRAVYNHIWVIGDAAAISVEFQAQVDELAEVAPVKSGSGDTILGPAPGTPEAEPGGGGGGAGPDDADGTKADEKSQDR